MSCKCARPTDQWHGWLCTVTDGECVYLFPNSKQCAKDYGEGPDADLLGDGEPIEVKIKELFKEE